MATLEHWAELVAACAKHGLPLWQGAAILEKESGGRNVYGHDPGGVFNVPGEIEVTEANFGEFLKRVQAGATSNGVGPMQITYLGHFPIMLARGLRPWVPADNIDYGIGLIAADTKRYGFQHAATRYNLGRWDPSWPYGKDAVARAAKWKRQLEEAPMADTVTIDGTEYTLRSSKFGTYVRYQDEAVAPGDLERLLATSRYTHGRKLVLTQGGLSDGALSGNTHLRLGVYDVSIRGWTKEDVWEWSTVAMWNGIRPFPRGFTRDTFQGRSVANIADGNEHLHVLVGGIFPVGHPARYQQVEYDKQGDGLKGPADYTGPWAPVKGKLWAESPYNPANRDDTPRKFVVNVEEGSSLKGLDINRNVMLMQLPGATVDAVAVVNRWDRQNALTSHGNFYAMQYLTPAA